MNKTESSLEKPIPKSKTTVYDSTKQTENSTQGQIKKTKYHII